MADYTGVWFLDPATFTPAIVPITFTLIEDEDVEDFADTYTPQEGCTP